MMSKDKLILFADGSVNAQSKIGYGAYLVIPSFNLNSSIDTFEVKVKKFEDTSSTKLEIQILLFVLHELLGKANEVVVYTDSQNIIGLSNRREALVQNDYRTKENKLHRNHDLYRKFFEITDQLSCEFIKVKGHLPSRDKSQIDRLFTLVDRAARKALKRSVANSNS